MGDCRPFSPYEKTIIFRNFSTTKFLARDLYGICLARLPNFVKFTYNFGNFVIYLKSG